MRFPGFIGPSYALQSVNVDAQRSVNLFLEMDALGTGKEREVASLVSTPGLTLLTTLATSPIRGLWKATNGELFAVAGDKFYSISSSWVATERGSLNTDTGPVSMADNGTYVVFVDGTDGFSWNIDTSTYAEITDSDFQPADQVTFQDGYFIFNKKDSQQFFISGLNDITFDALDISSAIGKPDYLVGLVSIHQNLYLFGEQSIEVFFNSGNADFPFERIQGTVIAIGCAAAFSIQPLEDTLIWLGGNDTGYGIVYQMQGFQARRISTPALEAMIRGLTQDQIADATAWTYQEGGHAFYCLNIPGLSSTWCYDMVTGFWHERTYRNLFGSQRHLAQCHALAYGKNIVGDYDSGKIYSLDSDVYTDNGDSIERIRMTPHFSEGLKRIFHNSFQLDMETGVGTDGTNQGNDPQVMLQWSDDGGHSWSNEYWKGAGKIGKTKKRVRWTRLGSSRDRVYRVKITDPVKVILIGAEIGIKGGAS